MARRLKFLIEVPDTVVVLSGSSKRSRREIAATTPELIIKALLLNEYHDNVFFDDKRINVKPVDADGGAGQQEKIKRD